MSATYALLKSDWMDLVLQGRITDDVKTVINMVRKDVLRTDRQHPFFAGEGNHNVTSLFNILTTYALNHSSVSYCQVQLHCRLTGNNCIDRYLDLSF